MPQHTHSQNNYRKVRHRVKCAYLKTNNLLGFTNSPVKQAHCNKFVDSLVKQEAQQVCCSLTSVLQQYLPVRSQVVLHHTVSVTQTPMIIVMDPKSAKIRLFLQ